MVIAVPKYRTDLVLQPREEKEGYMSITSRVYPDRGVFVINATARVIIELADGTRSLSNIYAAYASKFKDPLPLTQAQEDVNDVLKSLDKLGLIEWTTGLNPFTQDRLDDELDTSSGLKCRVALEQDLGQIVAFCAKFGLTDKPVTTGQLTPTFLPLPFSKTLYYEVALRNKLFEYYEVFFLVYREKQVVGLVSIVSSIPRLQLRAANLGLVLFTPDVGDEDALLLEIMDFACDRLNKYTVADNVKVRANLPSDRPDRDKTVSMLTAMNFSRVAILEHELGPGLNLELWDRLLPQSS